MTNLRKGRVADNLTQRYQHGRIYVQVAEIKLLSLATELYIADIETLD
jgi:hypothetical protein